MNNWCCEPYRLSINISVDWVSLFWNSINSIAIIVNFIPWKLVKKLLMFIDSFLKTTAKYFTHTSCSSLTTLWACYYYYHYHFSDEETNSQMLSSLSVVPRLLNKNQDLDQVTLTSLGFYYWHCSFLLTGRDIPLNFSHWLQFRQKSQRKMMVNWYPFFSMCILSMDAKTYEAQNLLLKFPQLIL